MKTGRQNVHTQKPRGRQPALSSWEGLGAFHQPLETGPGGKGDKNLQRGETGWISDDMGLESSLFRLPASVRQGSGQSGWPLQAWHKAELVPVGRCEQTQFSRGEYQSFPGQTREVEGAPERAIRLSMDRLYHAQLPGQRGSCPFPSMEGVYARCVGRWHPLTPRTEHQFG